MSGVGRPPVKKRFIVSELRRKIVGGEYPPGGRLPTRRELVEEYQTTLATVQQALEHLIRDGFVQAQGRRGTFVVEQPPHLHRYALVFPAKKNNPSWVRFWTVMLNVAPEVARAKDVKIATYTGIDNRDPGEDYQVLLDDVDNQRLAGIIFASPPFLVAGTPILETPGLPRVAIVAQGYDGRHLSTLCFINGSFTAKALDFLAARGRRRVAVLAQPVQSNGQSEEFAAALKQRGMESRYHWRQSVSLANPEWAGNCARLLFDPGNSERPDSLIIMDDNLLEHALAGLANAGIRAPADIDVVAHANFPWPRPGAMPVNRLGYDLKQVLQSCLDMLAEERRTGKHAAVEVPAVFEDELDYDVSNIWGEAKRQEVLDPQLM